MQCSTIILTQLDSTKEKWNIGLKKQFIAKHTCSSNNPTYFKL